VTRRVVTREK